MKFQKRRVLTNNKSYNPSRVSKTTCACVCVCEHACACLLSQSSQMETNSSAEKLCNWLRVLSASKRQRRGARPDGRMPTSRPVPRRWLLSQSERAQRPHGETGVMPPGWVVVPRAKWDPDWPTSPHLFRYFCAHR